jgi:hypothetical protein
MYYFTTRAAAQEYALSIYEGFPLSIYYSAARQAWFVAAASEDFR